MKVKSQGCVYFSRYVFGTIWYVPDATQMERLGILNDYAKLYPLHYDVIHIYCTNVRL